MNLRIDRAETFTVFAVEDKGILLDLRFRASGEANSGEQLFLARVKKLLPGVNAAILDLGEGEAYLGWQDLDPMHKKRGAKIAECLTLEERVLAQIRRKEAGEKADKATLRLSIPGAYGVYLPTEPGVSISSKIREPETRTRLEAQVDCLDTEGVILRTLASEVSMHAVNREIGRLRNAYQAVCRKAELAKSLGAFSLGIDPEFIFFSRWAADADQVISNHPMDQKWAKEWNLNFTHEENPLDPVWNDFSALRERQVALRGMEANILVEEMETLTAIDVNRRSGARDSVSAVDREAVREAMRQLRLRNIGGMVVMDIIDKRGAARTTRTATKEKKNDSHPIRVYGPSPMGLIELIRTKRGASLKQMTGTRGNPTREYAIWRLELAKRKLTDMKAVRIEGSRGLIEALKRASKENDWHFLQDWELVNWKIFDQNQEFLRILPVLQQ